MTSPKTMLMVLNDTIRFDVFLVALNSLDMAGEMAISL